MKQEAKRNLNRAYHNGQLPNKLPLDLSALRKGLKNIPQLAVEFEATDKQLRAAFEDKTTKDILANIKDKDTSKRLLYFNNETGDYNTIGVVYGSREAFVLNECRQGLKKAFNHSDDLPQEAKDAIRNILETCFN